MNDSEKLRKELFSLSDAKYRNFHASLMPNIDKERIIGIRYKNENDKGEKDERKE